jgi:hypothetical protein
VEFFKYLGRMLTNDGRCNGKIKSKIAMAKAALNKKRALFNSKLERELRKKLVKCHLYISVHHFPLCYIIIRYSVGIIRHTQLL